MTKVASQALDRYVYVHVYPWEEEGGTSPQVKDSCDLLGGSTSSQVKGVLIISSNILRGVQLFKSWVSDMILSSQILSRFSLKSLSWCKHHLRIVCETVPEKCTIYRRTSDPNCSLSTQVFLAKTVMGLWGESTSETFDNGRLVGTVNFCFVGLDLL